MGTLADKHTERIVLRTTEKLFENLLQIMDTKSLYLSIDDYAKYHSVSRSSIEKAIKSGMINEHNGGLKKGSGERNTHKRIYRFFNHLTGKVDFPTIS